VELLLSGGNGQPYASPEGDVPVEPATFGNVAQRFNDWEARCNSHEDNVAIFYFCGHGLQKESLILLPEDFGSNRNNVWMTAIDFDRTSRGMSQCQAQAQYYVADCCRQWSPKLLSDLDVEGQTLKGSKIDTQKIRTAQKLYATANGLPAFGDTGDVSRLTSALIHCLSEGGAEKERHSGGKWVVHTGSLGAAVQRLVRQRDEQRPVEDRQIVDPSGGEASAGERVLQVLEDGRVPRVIVPCRCTTDEATPLAEFWAVREQGAEQERTRPQPGCHVFELEADIWTFNADFPPGGGYAMAKPVFREIVLPPVWPVTVEVTNA